LTSDRSQIWTQNSPGIKESSETGDGFGGSVTSADFGPAQSSEGYADLAVRSGDPEGGDFPGAINIIYGSSVGLTGSRDQLLRADEGVRRITRFAQVLVAR
jgi:hypothetical protein